MRPPASVTRSPDRTRRKFAGASRPLDAVIDAALDGGVPFALLLAGYTGVLLSTSATPLWARKNWLGALFSASAVSTGASAIEMALQIKSPNAEAQPSHAPLNTIETAAKVVEAVTLAGLSDGGGQIGRAHYKRQIRAASVGRRGGRGACRFRSARRYPGEKPENAPRPAHHRGRCGTGGRFGPAVGHFAGRTYLRQRPTGRPRRQQAEKRNPTRVRRRHT